jgi:hypothetical protein
VRSPGKLAHRSLLHTAAGEEPIDNGLVSFGKNQRTNLQPPLKPGHHAPLVAVSYSRIQAWPQLLLCISKGAEASLHSVHSGALSALVFTLH